MSRGAGGRNEWADVVKGVSIVMVVLWHVSSKSYLTLPWVLDDLGAAIHEDWYRLNLAVPIRMPLFFLISGVFASHALARPWPPLLRNRVAPLFYLLVVWTAIQTVVLQLTPDFPTPKAASVGEFVEVLTIQPSNLWYLLALPLYVMVARATRAVPYLALAGALALYLAANLGIVPTELNQTSLVVNLFWFLIGTRLDSRRLGERLARVPTLLAVGLVAVFAVAAWVRIGIDARPRDDVMVLATLVVAALGVVAGFACGGVLGRGSRTGAAITVLGRRTLPIYVIHMPLVALVHLATQELLAGPASGAADSHLLLLLYPALATAAVVVACVGVHRLLLAAGCGWLFTAPWLASPAPVAAATAARHRRQR